MPSSAYLRQLASTIALELGIPPAGFLALVTRESGWDPAATGVGGEIGLTQVTPGAILDAGIAGDPRDAETNLRIGATYLRQQYDRFGSWPKALGAYNAGPGTVARAIQERGDAWLAGLSAGGQAYVNALTPAFVSPLTPASSASGGSSLLFWLLVAALLFGRGR